MSRTALIATLVSVVIVLSLIGVIALEQFEIMKLQQRNEELLRAYEGLGSFFFILDSDFTMQIVQNVFWGVEAWNRNPDSVCEIVNEVLHLFYNGTRTYTYGNSGVFQGKHSDGRFTNQSLLVGNHPEDAFSGDYVILPRKLQIGKFWLKTKFKIDNMGFNSYPSTVNIGMTLMCAINNKPFNLETQTLWLDVYFAGYYLNRTNIWIVPKDSHYADYPDDVHAGYYVGEVRQKDFGKWIELSVDLGEYISKTLNLITQVDTRTIRVYGFIAFVECLGAYAEVEYDHIVTYVT